MWETIFNFIFDKYPLITVFLFGVFFAWTVASFYFKRFCPLERELNVVKNRFKELDHSLKNTIEMTMKAYFVDIGLAKLPHESPISLSDEDKKILTDADFDQYIRTNKNLFFEYFEKDKPDNRAEGIKTTILLLMTLDELEKIDLNKLKDVGYQAGKTETQIFIIAGVYLWQNLIEPKFFDNK